MAEQVEDRSGRGWNRREAWRYVGCFSAGALAYPAFKYLRFLSRAKAETAVPELEIKLPAPAPVGASFLTKFNGRIVLIIHRGEKDWVALDGICTHMGCPLHYEPALKQVVCVCHKGHYDLRGQVLEGPPPRALKSYLVEDRADSILLHS